jgi:hypothetical protein
VKTFLREVVDEPLMLVLNWDQFVQRIVLYKRISSNELICRGDGGLGVHWCIWIIATRLQTAYLSCETSHMN